eukprot:401518_1
MSVLINDVQRLQSITSKYIKENCPFYFPTVLTNLCFKFFDYLSVLQIPSNYINLICEFGNPTEIAKITPISDEYSINDMTFELRLNSTWIGIRSIKMPQNIEYVRVLVNVYCKQTDYRYVQIHTFNKNTDFHYLCSIFAHECKHIETMEFSYYIDIISIKYMNKNNMIQIKPIKMKNKCNYKFTLDKSLIDKYKRHSEVNRYYSNTFDDTWYVASNYGICNINGIGPILCLRLLILCLPKGIGSIKTKHSIKCLNNNHIKDKFHKRIFEYDEIHFCFYHQNDFCIPLLEVNQSLVFQISIELVDMNDDNGNKIKRSDWKKYGIE